MGSKDSYVISKGTLEKVVDVLMLHSTYNAEGGVNEYYDERNDDEVIEARDLLIDEMRKQDEEDEKEKA